VVGESGGSGHVCCVRRRAHGLYVDWGAGGGGFRPSTAVSAVHPHRAAAGTAGHRRVRPVYDGHVSTAHTWAPAAQGETAVIRDVHYSVVALGEKPKPPGGGSQPALYAAPPQEPISVDELMAMARVSDAEVDLMPLYISAARQQAERDTDRAIAQQQYIVTYDELMVGPVELPWPPLVSIDEVVWYDTTDAPHVVDPSYYHADTASRPGRLIWTPPVDWTPPVEDTPRSYKAWEITLTAGYDAQGVPPGLKRAIGLLATHYLLMGRDLTVVGTSALLMPMGYMEAIQPFRLEILP
jgi:uncharacterized phiE125 gp8 family phage protein